MRKQILLLFLLIISTTYSQNILITELNSTVVSGGINVNVKTVSGTGSGYLSNDYTVIGNVIELSVCYWFDNTLPILQFDNDFFIPLTIPGNYQINVHIILSTSQVTCDNYANTDNGSLNTSYLETNTFEKNKKGLLLFPNPTSGKIKLKIIDSIPLSLVFFDQTGRLVKEVNDFNENSIDLNELNEGVYFIKIVTDKGIIYEKIIIKKYS
ncbi:T9SS type A sorting domain-containing protein [Flavobacterium jejuense]|uniref:T9SS type A sorting domain-containing protein n=1 Tax=Flavobacterium jejuense TaxID=1544455 RepID=A0ABX0IUV3_9FLAO|nr:T9SS type A sorting domain-containing protein [Flavobacterium jejuense]NHN27587.1 T9SS type A sorting domain-containing protein [Flavobacterium jejuense]